MPTPNEKSGNGIIELLMFALCSADLRSQRQPAFKSVRFEPVYSQVTQSEVDYVQSSLPNHHNRLLCNV